jgi:hypothetical protein
MSLHRHIEILVLDTIANMISMDIRFHFFPVSYINLRLSVLLLLIMVFNNYVQCDSRKSTMR